MRLRTILTLPAAPPSEKVHLLADWAAQKVAATLPARVRYWAFIQSGVEGIGDRVVTETLFMDVLKDVPGGPR